MAGKLRGPSSSKASPASTPIPLGTAKHKILKSNGTRKTRYTYIQKTYRHAYTHARTRRTHVYLRQEYLARKSVPAFLRKHSLSSKQERRNVPAKKRKRANIEDERERRREGHGAGGEKERG